MHFYKLDKHKLFMEFKHTIECDDPQFRALLDSAKFAYNEQNYGKILSCLVFYRRENRCPLCGVGYGDV